MKGQPILREGRGETRVVACDHVGRGEIREAGRCEKRPNSNSKGGDGGIKPSPVMRKSQKACAG